MGKFCPRGGEIIGKAVMEGLIITGAILKHYRAKWGQRLSLEAITTRVLKEQIARNRKNG